MKNIIFIFLFLFSYLTCLSQDTLKHFEKKYQFSIQAGGYYKYFICERYIDPTTYKKGDKFKEHQYDRFIKIPTYGFKTGLLIDIKFAKHWYFSSGLLFCFRKDVFENNIDTVIKYYNSSTIRNIHNTVKYDYSYNNIELPLMILFKWKRINFYAGVYLPVLTFCKSTYTYVVNQFPQNPPWITSKKIIKSIEIPLKIYPSYQISYAFKIKKHSLAPYLGFDFGAKKSFYIQGGIIFSVYNFNNVKKSQLK